jgi:CDP-diglyceride synthetase
VHDEISLEKTERSDKIASSVRNVSYLGIGALVAYAALLMILQGISFLCGELFVLWGASEATATLLGFLLVGVVVGAIGAFLIGKALETLKKEPLTPTKTVETLKEDKEWVQSKVP